MSMCVFNVHLQGETEEKGMPPRAVLGPSILAVGGTRGAPRELLLGQEEVLAPWWIPGKDIKSRDFLGVSFLKNS